MKKKTGLETAYALSSPDDNIALYRDWAATYDHDFAEANQYTFPATVAAAFADAGGHGPVLDVGAGTGLAGAHLASAGVGPIDAMDISQDMLDVAATKGVYARLFTSDLLARIDAPDRHYAGIISSGTFTHGHVGPEGLNDLMRVAAPGCLFALTINAEHYIGAGFAAKFEALSAMITTPELKDVPIYGPATKSDHKHDRGIVALFRRR